MNAPEAASITPSSGPIPDAAPCLPLPPGLPLAQGLQGLAPGGGSPRGELMTPEGYVISSVVLAVIGVMGFVCNGIVLLIYAKDKQLWTPLNLLLLNLVIGDFSVATIGTPFTFMASVMRRWIFGETMCVVYGFFMALMGITSISTLTVLSFERYMMISRPFGVGGLSKRGAVGLVAAAWLYSFGLTAPPLFGWGEYTNEAANVSCSVNWETRANNSTSYIVFLFILGLVVPVLVIVWSYVNIICTIRYNTIRIGQVTRAQQRIGIMVFLMVLAFLVAWTPYAIFALYAAFGPSGHITAAMGVIPALVAKSSVCYNPFIYVALNTQFRASWKRMWGSNSCDTSLEAGAEPSVPGEQAATYTQQTTAGYASPEQPTRRPNTPPPLYRKQRKMERLQRIQREEQQHANGTNNNNSRNNNNNRVAVSAPNSECAMTIYVPQLSRSAPASSAQDSDDSEEEQRPAKRFNIKRQKQKMRQLNKEIRKQSRAERQLEKALERHEREIGIQQDRQEQLEEKRRRKEDSLRRLQQQQFSAKFHPACLVALVTDPRNNSVLSVKVGESVSRNGGSGLLSRCFGKQAAEAGERSRQEDVKKKNCKKNSKRSLRAEGDESHDGVSVSSANDGIEVFEVEIRPRLADQDHRLPPTESSL